jgi:hypothetical protein
MSDLATMLFSYKVVDLEVSSIISLKKKIFFCFIKINFTLKTNLEGGGGSKGKTG